ncbi:BMP family lipoprotein [Butyrivibrio sp. WCD3002]|uniref:BMP family lipoprotein n=1 Tax=Butyrivibrio sp. WCD3002 TaxID=1280676 RepID=UPI000407B222|nr:BMP family ABC transporter substrate-binding protein [Butyrivibrio sp. WCD3002]
MKKLLAMMLTASLTFSLVACGGSSSDNTAETAASEAASEVVEEATTEEATEEVAAEETTEETAEETEEAAEATDDAAALDGTGYKIGLVTDVGGVNDQSFNQSAWEGLQQAQKEFGVEVSYLESSTDSDYASNIETFIDEDYNLIICVGYMLADATREAATANPDVKFAIIDDSSNADLDNVTCLTFKQEQASYLVGYVAGLTTKSNNVGFVLGMSSETMHLFGYGYAAGVLDANPDCTIQQMNANSFADSAIGKTDATQMITNGADVIFHAAGSTGLGVIEACQEAGDGIYAIGVDSDQNYLAPDTVITSAMKRVDVSVYDSVKGLLEGTIKGGEVVYDLSVGGVDIAPTTTLLSDDVISKVEDVKAKIISGEIKVPSSQSEFEATYGDVYELD